MIAVENHELASKYQFELDIDDAVDIEAATGRYWHFDRYKVVDPWDNDSRLFATMTDGAVTVAQELDGDSHLAAFNYDSLNTVVSKD